MALAAFTPSVWSARFQRILDRTDVYARHTNSDFEGEIKSYGDTVKIPFVGKTNITVSDYNEDADLSSQDRTATPAEMNGGALDLAVDQQKQFAILVEDVEELQTKPNLMDAAMQRSGQSVANVMDDYLRGIYNGAAAALIE